MFERGAYPDARSLGGEQTGPGEKSLRAVAWTAAVLLFASVIVAVLPRLENLSRRRMLAVAGAFAFICAVMMSKRLKELLLGLWVVSMTLFRPYSTFDGIFGLDGLYWVPSQAILAGLYGLWAVEIIILKRPLVRHSQVLWPLFVPFLIAATISAAQAQQTNWAATEIVRISTVIPIFIYCRYNLGRTEWQVCVAGLGLAMVAQFALGLLQVTTGKMLPDELAGPARAQGTMGHPNILADYFLLSFPAALALALTPVRPLLRVPALLVAAASGLGIVITLSRIPWALMVVQILLVCTGLVLLGMFSVKHFIGLCSVGALAAMIAAIPFAQKLEQRIKGDLKDSIQFRRELNTVAWLVFENNPFVGVGLNNLPESIFQVARKYGYHDLIMSETEWGNDAQEEATVVRRVTVHNLYMYLLAETGLLGLCALLLFLGSGLFAGLRAVRVSSGAVRVLTLGMTVGIAGALAHNFGEIALWLDPLLHTFALLSAMLFAIPALAARHGEDWLSELNIPDWMRMTRRINPAEAGGR